MAITAVKYLLHRYSGYTQDLCLLIIMAICFLLSHNYFLFDGLFFLQTIIAPMGSKFLPSLANLYMSFLEDKYIFSDSNPFVDDIVCYGHYIDDLIFIWGRDVASIPHFQE